MRMHFDLISDLHLDTWETQFDWTGQSTSPICVVAGDISRDRSRAVETLKHLGQCYQLVLYIDGNDEHKAHMHDLPLSYKELASELSDIPQVVFLQDNIVILNGVAFVSTNGWYSFDFDPDMDLDTMLEHWQSNTDARTIDMPKLMEWARADAAYLYRSIEKLQRHQDVKKIVIITHTVPRPDLVEHDIHLKGTYKHNLMGNSLLSKCLALDTEHKIHTWCFGHYHGSIDREIAGIRYVNNCRGRGNTDFCQHVYFPKRISVDF
jgi:predicted phosphodiesterase